MKKYNHTEETKEIMRPAVVYWKSELKELFNQQLILSEKISRLEQAITKYE